MCSPPSPTRSRTRGHRTATAPMPVTISRSGRCPWRTSRRRPSSVNLPVWVLSQAATSASTACPNSVLAPLRKTSVSGSENVPGWVSSKTLVSVTSYPSFGGEVEALNPPTIRRLTPSCRHQLSALALEVRLADTLNQIVAMLSLGRAALMRMLGYLPPMTAAVSVFGLVPLHKDYASFVGCALMLAGSG